MALLLLAAAGCDARSDKAVTQFSLTSSAFQDGGAIPAQFTCDGAGHSPSLAWGDPPAGTKSLALIVDDPDAPSGTFGHWAAYDIPASARAISVGEAPGEQAINGFGKPGYGAPCPPPGHGLHHYRFKLYALDVERLGVPANPKVAEVETWAQQHLVGRAQLIGTYERR
jgi:Raf kinase inhibitor-like YbhB/YbcL family protein